MARIDLEQTKLTNFPTSWWFSEWTSSMKQGEQERKALGVVLIRRGHPLTT